MSDELEAKFEQYIKGEDPKGIYYTAKRNKFIVLNDPNFNTLEMSMLVPRKYACST